MQTTCVFVYVYTLSMHTTCVFVYVYMLTHMFVYFRCTCLQVFPRIHSTATQGPAASRAQKSSTGPALQAPFFSPGMIQQNLIYLRQSFIEYMYPAIMQCGIAYLLRALRSAMAPKRRVRRTPPNLILGPEFVDFYNYMNEISVGKVVQAALEAINDGNTDLQTWRREMVDEDDRILGPLSPTTRYLPPA